MFFFRVFVKVDPMTQISDKILSSVDPVVVKGLFFIVKFK